MKLEFLISLLTLERFIFFNVRNLTTTKSMFNVRACIRMCGKMILDAIKINTHQHAISCLFTPFFMLNMMPFYLVL